MVFVCMLLLEKPVLLYIIAYVFLYIYSVYELVILIVRDVCICVPSCSISIKHPLERKMPCFCFQIYFVCFVSSFVLYFHTLSLSRINVCKRCMHNDDLYPIKSINIFCSVITNLYQCKSDIRRCTLSGLSPFIHIQVT